MWYGYLSASSEVTERLQIFQNNGPSTFLIVTHRTIVRDLTSPALSLVIPAAQFIAVNKQICRAIWLARRISLNTWSMPPAKWIV